MMEQKDRYIRFDWAVKRLLRNKANFGVLEGFLTVLLGEPIRIVEILESEGNQLNETDKFNRVDIKARNSKDEIIIVEVQNTREIYYLERILFGVAKAITEHIELGQLYSEVKKVYSISILYFDIGRGTDYLYHGQNSFVGVHTGDLLEVSTKEKDAIVRKLPAEIFPEYFLIRVNEFNKVAVTPLEEWIEYLKTGVIYGGPPGRAPGRSCRGPSGRSCRGPHGREAGECPKDEGIEPAGRNHLPGDRIVRRRDRDLVNSVFSVLFCLPLYSWGMC